MLETYWADCIDPKDPFLEIRQKSWDSFGKVGLPRPKQEAFQYLIQKIQLPKPAEPSKTAISPRDGFAFIDGFFAGPQTEAPFLFLPLDRALRPYGLFLRNRLLRSLQEETDPFALLNGVFQGRGAFLYLPPQCKAALHGTQIFTSLGMASPRLHVYLGRGAQLQLTHGSEGACGFCNNLFDFVLDEGASLTFCDRAEGHFQSIRATLKKESRFQGVFLGKEIRTSVKVQLAEENSEAQLFGLMRLEGDTESHIHATVEHKAPHTRSRQHFKSVLKDRSRFSYEGKIYVGSMAQKTEAYQLSNNLVLSDTAAAYAKPNLEIFADDVKASHGATVGSFDEELLFYLRSRGLRLEQAREWLIQGFCQEILNYAR